MSSQDSPIGPVIRTARRATFEAFQDWALRRRTATSGLWSNLPLALVSVESEQRDRALQQLAIVAERDYERKQMELKHKEEERRGALIDIVRSIDRVAKFPTGGSESAVLAAIARELQSVLRGALSSASKVELWVQDVTGIRRVTAAEGDAGESYIDDTLLRRVIQSGDSVYTGSPSRKVSGSLAKPEKVQVGLPLLLGEEKLGAILLECEGSGALTLEDRRYLELVAVQVSASVLTANLAGRMEHQTTVWAREQLAHHVLHSGGNAASNVSSNARELQRLLRDPRIAFAEDVDLLIEQIVADIITDAELVRKTLDTLRTEAVEETVFNLMTELRALSEEAAGEDALTVTVRGPDQVPILGVKALIDHAVANVVQNAIQAVNESRMRNGGVLICVSRKAGDTPRWLIDVEDSGNGVPDPIVDEIWEVGTHFRSRGNGYGLPFARRTLKAAGGELDYVGRSASLGGAHFRAWLPALMKGEGTIIGDDPAGRR
jgi:K+-sensing histidine kinase KdpD